MSQFAGYPAAAIALLSLAGLSQAQSNIPSDAWLMQNYRFTGPPAPGSVRPTDPIVSELWRIQNAILNVMHRAKSDGDYEAALAAASQASANAQAIGAVIERHQAVAAAAAAAAANTVNTTAPEQARPEAASPGYLIAFRDHTVATAAVYWTDTLMFHYLTPQGSHVQVRRELVDQALTVRLNRERNVEFRLPQ